jgi:DNA polymerase-3 subunit delta
MAEPHLQQAYLICGTDKPKVRRAAAKLRQRVLAETASELNVDIFDASLDSPAPVIEAANTAAFVLGTRLIMVLNAEAWKVPEREVVLAYLGDPAPETCLALVAASWAKTDRLYKAIERSGTVLRYDLPKKWELAGWVQALAKQRGAKLGRRAAQHLLAQVGDDPDLLEREIEKLIAYAGDETEISEAAIDAVCTPSVEARVWELTDAVGRRQAATAFHVLESLYASGEDANAALYSLLRHMRHLAAVVELMPDSPPAEIAKQLGVHTYTAQKLAEQRANFDRRSLGRAFTALAEAEAALRGGSPLALEPEADTGRLALEMALARIVERH